MVEKEVEIGAGRWVEVRRVVVVAMLLVGVRVLVAYLLKKSEILKLLAHFSWLWE